MGTGGGEQLSELRSNLPERVVATEEWATNVPVASRRLEPLGVNVVRCRSMDLPFATASFDIVLNRHEELAPPEVARVLRPGGCIVTQQVGREDWRELREFFPRMTDAGDVQKSYARGFEAAGLILDRNTPHDSRVSFGSVGDVVYMLLVSPWVIPDFSLERDLDALIALEDRHSRGYGVVLTESRFLLVATKPW
jgi:SAM-dependent methyltransferase